MYLQTLNKLTEFFSWSGLNFSNDEKDFWCGRLHPCAATIVAACFTGDAHALINRSLDYAAYATLQIRNERDDGLLASVCPQIVLRRLLDVSHRFQERHVFFRAQHKEQASFSLVR